MNIARELNLLLDSVDSGETDAKCLISDCRAISKSYGLGYGYIISRLATLTTERKGNEPKEF